VPGSYKLLTDKSMRDEMTEHHLRHRTASVIDASELEKPNE
jgi:hypothetical protein